ncbi:MAG TPA: amidase [Nitrososphaerales archaeon]|nr:amidase [Nitrososphaerales archaeon]
MAILDAEIVNRPPIVKTSPRVRLGSANDFNPSCAASMPKLLHPGIEEATIPELQSVIKIGKITSRKLVQVYLRRISRIDRAGPRLNSIAETNPDALEIATRLDDERMEKGPRGPLHGIPVVLKDSIATTDRMETTAGSLALLGSRPRGEAFVVRRLREAGAIILGKANLSEWANFRSSNSSSGWSARGGQVRNPYVLDRTPCGSSSGSAVAVAANLTSVAVGTETDGSIVCPSSINGVVGIKPTLGLVSRAGVIPVAHSQDTVGPIARTVTDAAILLGAMVGVDEDDAATKSSVGRTQRDYSKFLDRDGLGRARIGIPREGYFGYSDKADAIAEAAIERMRKLGARIIDPANIPTAKQMTSSEDEMTVLLHEFKDDLNRYLSDLKSSKVRSLKEVIIFNEKHKRKEMKFFGQDLFLKAQKTTNLKDRKYLKALKKDRLLSRQKGIDFVMDKHRLDALVTPTTSPAWAIDLVDGDHGLGGSSQPTALAGYPAITVPAGFVLGLPIGITFMGRAYSEPTLIRLAYAFEQATRHRMKPRYRRTVAS